MILNNYIKFILKKNLLIKYNFLNFFINLDIKNIFLLFPYYIYKLKLNFNIINFYKILLNIFNQRITLYKIYLKNIFKIKFILLNFILNIIKYNNKLILDYFLYFFFFNYNYYIKKKKYIILFNNKLLLIHYNIHNFYKKFYKYECLIIYKIFYNLYNNCKVDYNSYFYKNILFF
jgi:hypothetical protein